MFRIFNGTRRGLGEVPDESAIFCFFDVEFRKQLHYFKGANLAVFLAITLHSNEDGWSWPSASFLAAETGYNISTIRTAVRELCKLRIDGHRVLARYQPRKVADVNEEASQGKDGAGKFATNHYLIFPSEEEADECAGKGIKAGAHLPLVEKPLAVKPLAVNPLTKEEPVLKEEPKAIVSKSRKSKTEPSNPDYLDLALATKAKQDKHKLPITHLSEVVADLLGLSKVPNHRFAELWESPLSDLLDQADGDIERVEAALRAAVLEGRDNGITLTTPNSLHGLALQELADRDNGQEAQAKIAKEAAAQATMLRLAKEHGHI